MSVEKKIIDDKQFDDFFYEGRDKIPSLSPEWTNHNLSDPGITLLELLSWINEVLLYKGSVITERHRSKLLSLLSFEKRAVEPSKVWIKMRTDKEKIFLPKGYDIRTVNRERTLNFKLANSVYINDLNIENFLLLSENRFNSLSTEYRTESFYLFGKEGREGSAFYIGFKKKISGGLTFGFILERTFLTDRKVDRYLPDLVLEWSILTENGWEKIRPRIDTTDCFHRSGVVTFKIPQDVKPVKEKIPVTARESYYFLRCKIDSGFYDYPPKATAVDINLVPAVQVRNVKKEHRVEAIKPGSKIKISEECITSKKVSIFINGERWYEVKDLKHYRNKDPVFLVDRGNGYIEFGDGINGKIPKGFNITINCFFQTSSGQKGNIQPTKNWFIHDHIKGESLFTGYGGKEPESYEEAFKRAGKDLLKQHTCITEEDYRQVVSSIPDIKISKIKALRVPDRNIVKIFVLPESDRTKPEPSKGLLKFLCKFLNERRLITTKIEVLPPIFAQIDLRCDITVKENFNPVSVKKRVLEDIHRFLHPVKGGRDKDGWDFGDILYISDFYTLIESIEGVDGVFNLEISSYSSGVKRSDRNLYLSENCLPVSGKHLVNIIQKEQLCRS
ncbi:baseplate J/gp47 family protein [Persephonella sp.]